MIAHLLQIWLPVALGPAFAWALAVHGGWRLDPWGMMVVVAGSLVVYSGERLGDLRRPDHPRYGIGLRRALVMGLVAGLAVATLALALEPTRLLPAMLLPGTVALSYPILRRIPGGKCSAVALGWISAIAWCTPATTSVPWSAIGSPAAFSAMALIASGTLLCECKDTGRERGHGNQALLRWQALRIAFWGLAAAVMVPGPGLAVVALGLALMAPWNWVSRPVAGPLAVDALLILAGPLTALVG